MATNLVQREMSNHALHPNSFKRLRKFVFIFVCILSSSYVMVQNYYDHWAFGTNVHIDFTSGTPSVSCNSSINSSEAAAVWSNPATGDFIAYTSGNIVYNGQKHNVLANDTGLTANAHSFELLFPNKSIAFFYR
jgi:hypothetical protein